MIYPILNCFEFDRPMSFAGAATQKFKTVAVLTLLTGFSLFLLWQILSSAGSGCMGDVISYSNCRPDPLMRTYDLSGREVRSFWDIESNVSEGELVLTCGYVSNGTEVRYSNPLGRREGVALHLDRPVETGQHCFLAKVRRYTGPRTPGGATPAPTSRGFAGPKMLEVQKVLPPY